MSSLPVISDGTLIALRAVPIGCESGLPSHGRWALRSCRFWARLATIGLWRDEMLFTQLCPMRARPTWPWHRFNLPAEEPGSPPSSLFARRGLVLQATADSMSGRPLTKESFRNTCELRRPTLSSHFVQSLCPVTSCPLMQKSDLTA